MGNFYTNVTLRTGDAEAVADLLRDLGRDAYVTPAERGCVVVFDGETDENPSGLTRLVAELTRRLACVGLAVANVDDDVLWYSLHERGRPLDEYDSNPAYQGGPLDQPPTGGDAAKLCAAFGAAGREEVVRDVLHARPRSLEVYRHEALVEAIELPMVSAGTGYNYIVQGELRDVDPGALLRVGEAPETHAPPPPRRASGPGSAEGFPAPTLPGLPNVPLTARLRPSPELAAIVGEGVLRPEDLLMRLVKYVALNGLMSFGIPPKVRLDAKLRAVAGDRETLGMTELLPAVIEVGRTVSIVE